MRAPEFWHRGGIAGALLAPLGAVYSAAARLRERNASPWRAPVPVICVGNLTVGGAGKTPTALAIGRMLQDEHLRVAFLSRGYGGRLRGPVQVDPARHTARDVGDEPLLLAACAPSWIARDRKDGARVAIAEGVDVIVMDDGLQNPALAKDLRLVVVDGEYGFGNERVLPAGPLREPVARGLRRASAFVLVGEDRRGLSPRLSREAPLFQARLVPDAAARALAGRKVFAFAGIGRPDKFFATVDALGAGRVGAASFADHPPYEEDEVMRLVEQAHRLGATPVTTAKDFVRLPVGARPMVTAINVSLAFDDEEAVGRLLHATLDAAAARPREAARG